MQATSSGGIEWHAVQRAEGNGKDPEVIVSLSPGLEVLERGVNTFFVEAHTRLARSGDIPNVATNGHQPTVRRWTPAGGWQDVPPQ